LFNPARNTFISHDFTNNFDGAKGRCFQEYARQHFELFVHHATDESAMAKRALDFFIYHHAAWKNATLQGQKTTQFKSQ
jgi:hypothetical protein